MERDKHAGSCSRLDVLNEIWRRNEDMEMEVKIWK